MSKLPKATFKDVAIVFVFAMLSVLLLIRSWHVERWFNWKFGYNKNLQESTQKIEQLELKIERLERSINEKDNLGKPTL